jgi:hypothetical protein
LAQTPKSKMAWKVRRQAGERGRPFPFQVAGRLSRVACPPRDEFWSRYVQANRPVLIGGAFDSWPARTQWTDAYLTDRAGTARCEVVVSATGLFPDYVSRPEPMRKMTLALADLLHRSRESGILAPLVAEGECYYLYGHSQLFDEAPALKQDFSLPPFVDPAKVADAVTWISSAGSVTPLHYDLSNGLLCQLRGEKEVFLFPPQEFERLYFRKPRFPGLDNFERQSAVDIHHPDGAAFPSFAQASAFVCTLRPGDALFLPSSWPHEVETLSLSISVGFNFAGGSPLSELFGLVERAKRAKHPGNGADPPSPRLDLDALAGVAGELAKSPELLHQLLEAAIEDPAAMGLVSEALALAKGQRR